jgi:hypothetical protein
MTTTPPPVRHLIALACAALAGCEGAEPAHDGAVGHGLAALLAGECPPLTPFGAGVISTDAAEGAASFTRDGRTLYFHRRIPDTTGEVLMVSRLGGGEFGPPEVLPFSTTAAGDFDPLIVGDELFFASRRPVGPGRTDSNIWVVRRVGGGWSEPALLGPEVNSTGNDQFTTMTDDGLMYLASDRPGGLGGFDLYRAQRRRDGSFTAAQNLGPTINTAQHEFNPSITPDGKVLFFGNIGRPDSRGGPDIYGTVQAFGDFAPPFNLGDCINTAGQEFSPSLAWRRRSMVFVRNDGSGNRGDFFELGLRDLW